MSTVSTEDERHAALRRGVVQGGFDLTGVVDLHVHTAPCIFPRLGDDIQVATGMRDAGVRAFAMKSHHESTVGRAYLTRHAVSGIDVIGGVTLNWPVGGMNPAAVEVALMTGGRMVWGPSGHSQYHGHITGEIGKWGVPGMELPTRGNEGVTALDEQGRLTEDAQAILDLVTERDALFATSHLGPDEIRAVLQYARTRGTRVLVNHVIYMPRCDEDFIQEIVSLGGYIEFISALILPTGSHFDLDYTFARLAAIMRKVGFDNCVISSDAGGVFMGLWPHEQLRMFGQGLIGAGISEDDVRKMMSTNPASLVRLQDN
jgi:hypothetical protein